MSEEIEIISRIEARALHHLLTSYKVTVANDEDYDGRPAIDGLNALMRYARFKADRFSLEVLWIPLEGYDSHYCFSPAMKVKLYPSGLLELTNRCGDTLSLQLWQHATFTNTSLIDNIKKHE